MAGRERLDDPNYDWQSQPWPSNITTLFENEAVSGDPNGPLNSRLRLLVERTDYLYSRLNELSTQVEAALSGGGGGFGGGIA